MSQSDHDELLFPEIIIKEYSNPDLRNGHESPDSPYTDEEKWKLKLSQKKKDLAKVKSRIRSCQVRMEKQEEQLRSLQEEIAKKRSSETDKSWEAVKAAHLISKIFCNCQPIPDTQEKAKDPTPVPVRFDYTAEFHKFAIALYFFVPKAYYFVSSIVPLFPQKHYIRQWVHSESIENLFPDGIPCTNKMDYE